ncbi:hypothetical protein Pint_17279 [Pistacia integerrima]|uniref:Uncharacterized protein n=1 Tax=Pistacia integerrima TaxID=434235 RepID=A0ACC0YUG8_9ROSI|nr:hypothetical protein Pint_17279 [Pistacia integerrima]
MANQTWVLTWVNLGRNGEQIFVAEAALLGDMSQLNHLRSKEACRHKEAHTMADRYIAATLNVLAGSTFQQVLLTITQQNFVGGMHEMQFMAGETLNSTAHVTNNP